jgi:hypothetical protein
MVLEVSKGASETLFFGRSNAKTAAAAASFFTPPGVLCFAPEHGGRAA